MKKKSLVGYMFMDLWKEYTKFEKEYVNQDFEEEEWAEIAIAKKRYKRHDKPKWGKVRITIEEIK